MFFVCIQHISSSICLTQGISIYVHTGIGCAYTRLDTSVDTQAFMAKLQRQIE